MTTQHGGRKNILITHVYSSDNKGDAALTSVLVDDLNRSFPGANITILRLDPVPEGCRFEGVPEKPSFMSYALNKYRHPLVKLAYTIYMITATLVAAFWLRHTGWHLALPRHLREVADLYEQADLIVPVGGGYMRSRKGLFNRLNVPLLLHPLLFGSLLGKPTVLYSQSVGPFQNKLEECMVGYVLRRMTLVLLREDTSLALLASLGVTRNVSRAIDSGFLLRSKETFDIRKRYGISPKKLLIGVTVRSWLEGDAQRAYERAVARSLDTIVASSNVHVIFIPQVTASRGDDDRIVSQRVRQLMRQVGHVTVINDEPDHHRIKAVYDSLDILLGTRFHSVIFSLTSYVPVVAIEYEHKTSGIMRDLKLEGWVVKIEEVTEQNLTRQLQRLIHSQESYRRHLRKHLPPYVQQAEHTVELLEQSVTSV